MSYNMSFNEESNVAYLGTSEDLQFGGYDGFLKEGADMQLFGGFEETSGPAERALYQSLSAFNNSTNPATVSPQELSMAPPQSGYIPSSASIPELTPAESLLYDYSGSDTPLFSNPNSADPSPVMQDDMAPSSAYQGLESLFAIEEPYVPTGADLRARHTDSLPPTPKSAALGPVSTGIGKKPRKTNRPLKVLHIESITDDRERKKAKNTEAARRSRAKRANHEAALEARIEELQQQLAAEKAKNEQLQAYINGQLPRPM